MGVIDEDSPELYAKFSPSLGSLYAESITSQI